MGDRRLAWHSTRASARSPVFASVALVVVLLGLATLVAGSNQKLSAALEEQSQALAVDGAFSAARLAVATEALAVRNYRVEPSAANLGRLTRTLGDATVRMDSALAMAGIGSAGDGRRLRSEQAAVVEAATTMAELALAGDDDARRVADMHVAPAYYVLQSDLDRTASRFHDRAQRRLLEVQQVSERSRTAQSLGGAVASVVVILVLRMLLLYQRRVHNLARMHEHDALHDSLTGLPNRVQFHRALWKVVEEANAAPDSSAATAAVALIDLDGFKGINDTYGHQGGDTVLVAVADVLRARVRTGDLVARLGGDEFAVLLRGPTGRAQLEEWATATAAALRCEVPISGGNVAVSGSVGVCVLEPNDDAGSVAHRADLAMYQAKTNAGNGAWIYDSAAPGASGPEPSVELLSELRQLLDAEDPDGQLELHYQPQVRCVDGSVCGVEALARWRHPERGMLLPETFMPDALAPALQAQLSKLLVLRVVDAMPAVLATLGEAGGGASSRVVAVNIAASTLAREAVADSLLDRIDGTLLAPSHLRVEIGHLDQLADPSALEPVVRALRERGIGITLDNFGLDTAVLDVLRRLPIDEVKIDRSFVIGERGLQPDERLLRASAALAHGLELQAAAQGVESRGTYDLLVRSGFDSVQGHHISPPVPLDELAGALRHRQVHQGAPAQLVALPQQPERA